MHCRIHDIFRNSEYRKNEEEEKTNTLSQSNKCESVNTKVLLSNPSQKFVGKGRGFCIKMHR